MKPINTPLLVNESAHSIDQKTLTLLLYFMALSCIQSSAPSPSSQSPDNPQESSQFPQSSQFSLKIAKYSDRGMKLFPSQPGQDVGDNTILGSVFPGQWSTNSQVEN